MDNETFQKIKSFMVKHLRNTPDEIHHSMRVLDNALKLAKTEDVNELDVLIAAAIMHDIGRGPKGVATGLGHAKAGSIIAYQYLINIGWEKSKAKHTKNCIRTHSSNPKHMPQTIEAKVLFDADKLDQTGKFGMERMVELIGHHEFLLTNAKELENRMFTKSGQQEARARFAEAKNYYINLLLPKMK